MKLNPNCKTMLFCAIICITFMTVCTYASIEGAAGNGSKLVLLSPDQQAPSCQLTGIDNVDYSFPVPGNWNIIFFWSLFCHSCVEEIPAIQNLLVHSEQKNLQAFFISLDSSSRQKALLNFCSKRNLTQPVLMEQLASDSYLTADQWGVSTTPSVFIVAPDGKIAYSHQGPMDLDKFFSDFSAMSASYSESLPPENH